MDVGAVDVLDTASHGTRTYDDTLHYTSRVGNTASLTFSGMQFLLSYTQNPHRGSVEVYVYGNKISTVNANGALQWQKTYTINVMPMGAHLVQLKYADSGTYIDVDVITIN